MNRIAVVIAAIILCCPVILAQDETAEDVMRELYENLDLVKGWMTDKVDEIAGDDRRQALSGGAVELEFEIPGVCGPIAVSTAVPDYALNSSRKENTMSDTGDRQTVDYAVDAVGHVTKVEGGWLVECAGTLRVFRTTSSGANEETTESELEFSASSEFKSGQTRTLVKQDDISLTLRVRPQAAIDENESPDARVDAPQSPVVEQPLDNPAQ